MAPNDRRVIYVIQEEDIGATALGSASFYLAALIQVQKIDCACSTCKILRKQGDDMIARILGPETPAPPE